MAILKHIQCMYGSQCLLPMVHMLHALHSLVLMDHDAKSQNITSVEPVKLTLSMSMCSATAAPAVCPKPGMTLTTPAGNPAWGGCNGTASQTEECSSQRDSNWPPSPEQLHRVQSEVSAQLVSRQLYCHRPEQGPISKPASWEENSTRKSQRFLGKLLKLQCNQAGIGENSTQYIRGWFGHTLRQAHA